MPKNTPIVYDHLAKFYARKYTINNGMSLFGDGVPATMFKYQKELEIDKKTDIKYDLTPEDIKRYYDYIKQRYGIRFGADIAEFTVAIDKHVEYFRRKNLKARGDTMGEEEKKDNSKQTENLKEKTEEKKQMPNEKPKEEPKEEKEEKKTQKETEKKKDKQYSVDFLEEMRNQIKRERSLYRQMKEKKEEVVQAVNGEDKPTNTETPKPAFNWTFVLVAFGAIAGLLLLFNLFNKNKSMTPSIEQQTPSQPSQIPSVPRENGVISASELLSRMG